MFKSTKPSYVREKKQGAQFVILSPSLKDFVKVVCSFQKSHYNRYFNGNKKVLLSDLVGSTFTTTKNKYY